jgi:hypothetical protein
VSILGLVANHVTSTVRLVIPAWPLSIAVLVLVGEEETFPLPHASGKCVRPRYAAAFD